MGKHLSVNYKELAAFGKRMERLSESVEVLKNALKKVAEEYLASVITRTPVDTGRLKKQWELDNLAIVVDEIGSDYVVYLVNSTEYASWVENGHESYNQFGGSYGWVYGRFFVRKTDILFENGRFDAVVKNRLERWLKEVVNGN